MKVSGDTGGLEGRSNTGQAGNIDHDGQTGKISIEDIEGRLRSLTSRTGEEADSVRDTAGKYTVVVLGIAVVAAYLIGRHRGRLKSAVIEIKRG